VYNGGTNEAFIIHVKEVLSLTKRKNYFDYYDGAVMMKDDCIQRFNKAQKKSDDAIFDIQEKVDFVYIDGHHTYEQVKKDIQNYKKLIKDNGIVGGHDYSVNWKDVIKAVNECLGVPDNVYVDCSWIKKM
jgi:hypothetical protein